MEIKLYCAIFSVIICNNNNNNFSKTKLHDSDSKVHPLKAGTSSVLATIATARGDTRASLLLGQRAMQERGTRNPNLMAADAISLANTAVGAGEFEIAEEMVRVAQKVQSEKGLPALSVRTLERVVASLAAAKANGAAVLPVEEPAVATPPEEASTPLARMQAGLLRAKLSMRKADWVNVRVACEPWLASNSAYELPIYLRGEFLLVAAEAEHRFQGSRARALIDEASAIFERIDVPHSKRLARSRALSAAVALR